MNKKYSFFEVEEKWKRIWNEKNIYRFKESANGQIFSIDTPPPTVVGKMHLGHSFGYTLLDFIARFKRMNGFNIFFPFGFDDNGLPTQALIEKITGKKAEEMNRLEFVELCLNKSRQIEAKLREQWIALGISADWNRYYSTIDKESRRISQHSFLKLFNKGQVYLKEAPFFWCPNCKKAVSQKETKHINSKVKFYNVPFKVNNKKCLIVSISRLEFLPGCVALFVNPNDKRYEKYVGLEAEVPLFGSKVPILTDRRISPKRGTGIKMCSTFADNLDVVLFLAHGLQLKKVMDEQRKLTALAKEFEGIYWKDAREAILEKLKSLKLIDGESEGVIVDRIHKECGNPITYQSKKQWFVRTTDLKDKLIDLGNQIKWHPQFMKKRFDKWIKDLEWDWNISRQRKFGVPFPVWYCQDCGEVILGKEEDLPIDPLIDVPPVKECPKCNSTQIIPETDVMDTWATSSLNPFIITNWLKDRGFFNKMFPINLRVQSHDIIYTWFTYSLIKSYLHEESIPCKEVMIHGFVNDENSKKVSLSKGNFKGVFELINSYGADAVRYWASSKNLGEDIILKEMYLRRAKKVINKLWNASRLVKEIIGECEIPNQAPELRPIEKWLFYRLDEIIKSSTENFENYKFSDARRDTEHFFIKDFSNIYLRIIKAQLKEGGSDELEVIRFTVYNVFLTVLKLLAPIMPYITEEIYHQFYTNDITESIHLSSWPTEFKLKTSIDYDSGELLKDVIKVVRRELHNKKISLKGSKKERIVIKVQIPNERYSNLFNRIQKNLTEFFGIKKIHLSQENLKNKSPIYQIGVELQVTD